MGYGLVAVPKQLWRAADVTGARRMLCHRAGEQAQKAMEARTYATPPPSPAFLYAFSLSLPLSLSLSLSLSLPFSLFGCLCVYTYVCVRPGGPMPHPSPLRWAAG
jgi:hypothetical protein